MASPIYDPNNIPGPQWDREAREQATAFKGALQLLMGGRNHPQIDRVLEMIFNSSSEDGILRGAKRLFTYDKEPGPLRYGKHFIPLDEDRIDILPPPSSSTNLHAGYATFSDRADSANNHINATRIGKTFKNNPPKWFVEAWVWYVTRAKTARAILRSAEGRPSPEAFSEKKLEQLFLPTFQYCIRDGQLMVLDYDDLPEESACAEIVDKIGTLLQESVEVRGGREEPAKALVFTREKSSGHYGAHIYLVNLNFSVANMRLLAQMLNDTDLPYKADMNIYRVGADTGVPGTIRGFGCTKVTRGVYQGPRARHIIYEPLYAFCRHGSHQTFVEDVDAIRRRCRHVIARELDNFCPECSHIEDSFLFSKSFPFQSAPFTLLDDIRRLDLTALPAVALTYSPTTPFLEFNRLPPTHQAIVDIPTSIEMHVREMNSEFSTAETAISSFETLCRQIIHTVSRCCITMSGGIQVGVFRTDIGKRIIAPPGGGDLSKLFRMELTKIIWIRGGNAAVFRAWYANWTNALKTGITISNKKKGEDVSFKFFLSKIVAALLACQGSDLEFIPYNPLLLEIDYPSETERNTILITNRFVPWHIENAEQFAAYTHARHGPGYVDDEFARVFAESFRLMRRIFNEPRYPDNDALTLFWLRFLQVRLIFPAMRNRLVSSRATSEAEGRVPPLAFYFEGQAGSGKSHWATKFLAELFGRHNCEAMRRISGRFDSVKPETYFALIDECTDKGIVDFVKQSTDTIGRVENKFQTAQQVRAGHNVIIVTNSNDDAQVRALFGDLKTDDRRIVVVHGVDTLSSDDTQLLTATLDSRVISIWRCCLTRGFSEEFTERICHFHPAARYYIDELNSQAGRAIDRFAREELISEWLQMRAPMTPAKQDAILACQEGLTRFMVMMLSHGLSVSAAFPGLPRHIAADPAVWEGNWLRLVPFSVLKRLYELTVGHTRHTANKTLSEQNIPFIDKTSHRSINSDEYNSTPEEVRREPRYSATIDDNYVHLPSLEVCRQNWAAATGMRWLPKPYVADGSIRTEPCRAIVAVLTGVRKCLMGPGGGSHFDYPDELQEDPIYKYDHLRFDVISAPVFAWHVSPERLLDSDTLAEFHAINNGDLHRKESAQAAQEIILRRGGSASAKRAEREEEDTIVNIDDDDSLLEVTPLKAKRGRIH